MFTFIKLFPIVVAVKNTQKLIYKWPHVNPAKSKRGFGIEAKSKTVIKECFSM